MSEPFLEGFTHRLASAADETDIAALMDAAIGELLRGFLSPEQVAVSHSIMGLDRQRNLQPQHPEPPRLMPQRLLMAAACR